MLNHSAIYATHLNVVSIVDGDCFDKDGKLVAINETLVNEWANAQQYKSDRAKAYPSFADQFDALYHGGYDAWKAMIDEIKNKYPKP